MRIEPRMVDNVNMPYHHGNLREALVLAGVELARKGGPESVTLREASRAAGVSHNAAYRHFADRDDLLRAVCEQCMTALAALMDTRLNQLGQGRGVRQAWDRLRAVGRAYIDFALAEPGMFRTAFGVPTTAEALEPSLERHPYGILSACLDNLVDVGALDPSDRPGAELAPWSAVHGLASLLVDGPLKGMSIAEREAAIDRVLGMGVKGL